MKNKRLELSKLRKNCMRTIRVKLSDIKQGHMKQDVLPDGFIERVINYKKVLGEVETSSLEKAISNFQRDLYPETELMIWESIANSYKLSVSNNPNWTLSEKKLAFAELLKSSMGN